jgi:vacuolar-type H+-ATPase subunit H
MREVIQGLLEAEAEARHMVESARQEADALVADAEKRCRELAAEARQAARAEAVQTIDAAVEAAQLEKSKQLEKAAADIDRQTRIDEATRERLAQAVVRCLCGEPPSQPESS